MPYFVATGDLLSKHLTFSHFPDSWSQREFRMQEHQGPYYHI